jgi:hypothetical protein
MYKKARACVSLAVIIVLAEYYPSAMGSQNIRRAEKMNIKLSLVLTV